ncbi:hypothetical protein MTX37_28840 [Rhodococcus sp. ARC_M8]|uniref:hypothetical protein n=1 Tax=Rhodococcus sp. ARC_M8 TaxID=2928853 RepID=UPI001FB27FEB|nr:hypothetical protein [Rhodococcus sp. ARC_M8]MCJ0949932.1 hypothetical protein [Rhodococcus sp. ARC_M8]
MSTTPKRYVIVDVEGRVCPDQRKSARETIDYRAARALNTQATGRTRFGRTVRTALAADGLDNLIRHAFLDTKLSWPLSIYEVSGDKETGVARDPGLRRLDGINVHREIRASELFGHQGSDVVDLIEKLYYTDDFELANAAAAKKFDTFSNILVELRPTHTEAKGKLISAAVQAGLLDEMLLANKLASRAAGLSVNFFDTLTGYPLTDIGCAAAAIVVRDYLSAADHSTLTAPLSATLAGPR